MELVEWLSNYWAIFIFIGGLIATWVRFKFQNDDQETRLKCLEAKMESMNPIWADIQSRLASIETTLKLLVDKKIK